MTFGIDVLIMAIVGLCMMLVTVAFANKLGLTCMQREVAVASSAATAATMVVAYIIMARVLDMMLGANW